MKKFKIGLLTLLLLFTMNLPSHGVSEEILVGLSKKVNYDEEITLSSDYGFTIYEDNYGIMEIRARKLNLRVDNRDNLYLMDDFGDILYTGIVDHFFISGEDYLYLEGNQYRGSIGFTSKSGSLKIINKLDIEEYIYGVLPREISASFPEESIKAQAIVSRTYALKNMHKHTEEGYNLCDTTHCQVYGAMNGEVESLNRLVDATRGQKIYYRDELVDASFHSNNGGYIESSKDVWGGELAYLISKPDPYSMNTVNSNWEFKISKRDLEKKLSGSGINVGNLLSINILDTSESGRIKNLEIIGDLARNTLSGSKFRDIMGNSNFKSTLFSIEGSDTIGSVGGASIASYYIFDGKEVVEKNINGSYVIDKDGIYKYYPNDSVSKPISDESITDVIVFKGKGFGHGVGLSQFGAKAMAEQGFTYEDIISHYYSGVEIKY